MLELDKLINTAVALGASDIHLDGAGQAVLRLYGRLQAAELLHGYADDVSGWLRAQLNPAELAAYRQQGCVDFAYAAGGQRCRVNAFRCQGELNLSLRLLPDSLPSLQTLGLEQILQRQVQGFGGLIIIGGGTGAGKSTTAGAMLEWINQHYSRRIVTLEDPIEYLFESKRACFCQREYGRDFTDFAAGVRAALRQNVDVLFIGEIREAKAAAAAFSAAASGRLVLATLHCADTVQAVERLTMLFDPAQQQYARFQLAVSLRCIINQRLLRLRDASGLAAIQEIMVVTAAVASLIRENKYHQLYGQLELGSAVGMRTFKAALATLKKSGCLIDGEYNDADF